MVIEIKKRDCRNEKCYYHRGYLRKGKASILKSYEYINTRFMNKTKSIPGKNL